MSIRIRSRSLGTLIGGDLAVDIDHTEDSFTLGDGTNTLTLDDVGGQKVIPVKPIGGGDATAANQTSGDQKTQIVDPTTLDAAEVEDVGGEKALKVSVISSIGGGAAPAHTDKASYTAGSSVFTPIGGVYQSTPDTVSNNQSAALRMTSDRRLMVDTGLSLSTTGLATESKQDSAISELQNILSELQTISTDMGTLASVDFALDSTLQTIDSVLDNILAKLNSSIAVTGTFYQATQPVSLASVPTHAVTQSGSWSVGQSGSWSVGVSSLPSLPAGSNNIGDVDVLTLPGINGSVAHDASDSGNPVKVGGVARNTNPTAVGNGDRVNASFDLLGKQIVTPHAPRDLVTHATGTQATTNETTMLAAGGSGVYHDVTKIILTNSHASNSAQVQIRDATGGTIRLEMIIAPNGGAVLDFGNVPMCQTTANNAWTIDLQAAVSTVYWYIQAIKRTA